MQYIKKNKITATIKKANTTRIDEESTAVSVSTKPTLPALLAQHSIGYDGVIHNRTDNLSIMGNGCFPRFYSPEMKQFLSPDSFSPFGIAGPNRFHYCANNPISNKDPSGHLSAGVIFAITLATLGTLFGLYGLFGVIAMAAGAISAGAISFSVGAALAVEFTAALFGVVSGSLSIASGALSESDPDTSAILGYASLAFGITSLKGALGLQVVATKTSFNIAAKIATQLGYRNSVGLGTRYLAPNLFRRSIPKVTLATFKSSGDIVRVPQPLITKVFGGSIDLLGYYATPHVFNSTAAIDVLASVGMTAYSAPLDFVMV